MDVLREARYRLRNQEWEDSVKQRRFRDFEAALDRLDQEEHLASFPDNENRVRDLERIRAQKREVLAIMDEDFRLSEQYKQIANS